MPVTYPHSIATRGCSCPQRHVLLAIALFFVSAPPLVPADEKEPAGPDRFWIHSASDIPMPYPAALGFEGEVFEPPAGTPGIKFTLYAKTRGTLFPKADTDNYTVGFPPVDKGDILRVLDGIYRVDALNPVEFKRLKEEELPKGVSVTKGTYSFPIPGRGYLHHGFGVKLPKKPVEGKPQVEIDLPENKDPNRATQTLAAGDLFWIVKKAYRVRSVVLPDPKRKIIGYFEVDQEPAKTEE